MLSPYRVLDLCDDRGLLTGLVLAQLGAEVVALEPPGGHAGRRTGPFPGDDAGAGPSLWYEAYQRGRVVVTGDAGDVPALAATADILLESGAFDLDLERLRRDHPTLIVVSVSAHGLTGPKAGWAACDLTLEAASGHMVLNGDADRAPVRISEPQAFHHAAIEAAVHAVAALAERRRSGAGQHIDVAAQHALLQASQIQMLAAAVGAPSVQRHAGGVRVGPYHLRFVYPASDGHVSITFLFGDMIGRFTQRLMQWVHERGCCSEAIRDLDYVRFFELIYSGELEAATLTAATDAVAELTATLTKAELFDVARRRQLLIAPVTTTADTLANEQFAARGYWDEVPAPAAAGGAVRLPGPWAHCTATPLRRLDPARRIASGSDEHARLLARRPAPAPGGGAAAAGELPLAGIHILDFSWVLAGPFATRLLADLGATVVRIETDLRPDVIRAAGPFMAGHEGGDATALWHSVAAGKRSLQLDITTDEGRQVVLDLARWAHLAVESYSAGTIRRLGYDHDTLCQVNPGLVMVSSSLFGQDGPLVDYAGFGNLAAAIAGFYEITGWPDRPPAGPFTAYTDYVSPRFLALACVAALDHAQRTGEGQYVDVSQAEATLHLLSAALLDTQVNGRTAPRRGNADPYHAPHGVYPAAGPGEDRWVAIACTEERHWTALAAAVGAPASIAGLTREDRRARIGEIDGLVAAWTAARPVAEIETALQGLGIPAHQVQNSPEILADPQLCHRGYAVQRPHPLHGSVWVEGSQARWSRTQPEPAFAGPPCGHDTHWVLSEVLGYDDERIADLVIAGAIT